MKRFFAIVLSLLLVLSACFCTNAANTDRNNTGEKVVFKVDGWAYEKVNAYGYEIDEYYGNNAEPSVPWSFAKEYVTSIGNHAFLENTAITSVDTTSKIETIGAYAFNGCTSLKKVTLYDSLTTMGTGCFYGDTSLKSVNMLSTSITAVPAYCFAECGIGRMALPATCESIGNYAFYNCEGLNHIVIPDSVTSIADTAFSGCEDLIIVCSAESYAAQYAQANNIAYLTPDNFVLGDADGNNQVTIRDVTYIQLYLVGLRTLDNTAYIRSDVNGDGNVNIRDVTYIQMYRAQLIDNLYNI